MVRVVCASCVVIAALAACLARGQQPAPVAAPSPRGVVVDRLALLVGINTCQPGTPEKFGNLPGAANDLALMERTLRHPRFGFTGDQICVLRDEQASRAGFVAAFDRHLLQRARKGTEVFLYFTGHGSLVPDPTGREAEVHGRKRDSTWLLWDSRVGHDGAHDLTDDVVYSLVHHLTTRIGARVVAVTDSCHSGGSLRGGDWQARSSRDGSFGSEPVTSVAGWPSWPESVPFVDDDRRPGNRELENYVHLAACANDQTAWEGSHFATQRHGMFTFALCTVLDRTRPGDPWSLVARRTRNMMLDFNPPATQTPWHEGDLARAVFTGGPAPPADGIDVIPGDGPSALLRGGRFHGLDVGAEVAVTSWPDGVDRGRIRIEYATYGESMGRWLSGPPERATDSVLSARIVVLPKDMPPLKVWAEGGPVGLLARTTLAELVTRDQANYVLSGQPPELRTIDGIRIWPLTGTAPQGEAERRESLQAGLRCELQFLGFWLLCSSERRGQLGNAELCFREPREIELHEKATADTPLMYQPAALAARGGQTEVAIPDFDVQDANWKQHGERKPMTVLEVTNQNTQDLHLALLSVSENREMNVITQSEGDRLLAPGRKQTFRIWLGAPTAATWSQPRPMRDRYLAIFSKSPLDLQDFVARRNASDRGSDDVPGVLQQAMTRSATRGGGSISDADRGWGVQWVELLVQVPKK